MPRSVTAKAGKKSLTARWKPPSSTGGAPITGYTVEYATCKVDSAACQAKSVSAGTSRSVTIKKLSASHKYYVEVIARNPAGSSRPSARVSARPKA